MIECMIFEKVSFKQFKSDVEKLFGNLYNQEEIEEIYSSIRLPERATKGSAGYDFFLPMTINFRKDVPVTIPTGIRVKFVTDGWYLGCYPKSGLGFKYGMELSNTIGVVDFDYFFSDNEGHIMARVKMTDIKPDEIIRLNSGSKFFQGIASHYGLVLEDNATAIRNGGFGSTGR